MKGFFTGPKSGPKGQRKNYHTELRETFHDIKRLYGMSRIFFTDFLRSPRPPSILLNTFNLLRNHSTYIFFGSIVAAVNLGRNTLCPETTP